MTLPYRFDLNFPPGAKIVPPNFFFNDRLYSTVSNSTTIRYCRVYKYNVQSYSTLLTNFLGQKDWNTNCISNLVARCKIVRYIITYLIVVHTMVIVPSQKFYDLLNGSMKLKYFLKLWQVDHFLLWGMFKFITRKAKSPTASIDAHMEYG